MGGAERRERERRKQALSRPPVSTAPPPSRRRVGVALVVVAVVVAAVAGGVIWQRSRSGPGDPQVVQLSSVYPVQLTPDGVVEAGAESAELTVDVYEDFLCPACGTFEQRDGAAIEDALAAGDLKVRYHVVNILDNLSNPTGYSTDAANAALCAAEQGEFPSYHASLFAKQPREGGRGYTDDQLVKLGSDLGITSPDFESCVRTGTHDATINALEERVGTDPDLQREFPGGRRGFATPTVVVDGRIVDLNSTGWLSDALGSP